jgi:hypothetical protein
LARWSAVALAVLVVVGCGEDRPASPSLPVAEDPGVVHVHGLGINPQNGRVYAATHTGLFVIGDGTATRVSDRLQDTMGFTVVGPDQFLGSGHPDFRDTQLYDPARRPLLGLIESRDAGRSWRPLSLLGEADFHDLQIAHGRVYGYDATGQRFMTTADRTRWQVRSTVELVGFAVSPTDPRSSSQRPGGGCSAAPTGAATGSRSRGRTCWCWTGRAQTGCGGSAQTGRCGAAPTPPGAGSGRGSWVANPRRCWSTTSGCMRRSPARASSAQPTAARAGRSSIGRAIRWDSRLVSGPWAPWR